MSASTQIKSLSTEYNSTALRQYLDKNDAASYLGISIRTLTDWMHKRIISYIKPTPRKCMFRLSDLDKAMDRFRRKAIGE